MKEGKEVIEEAKELIAYLNIHDNEIREEEGSQIKHRLMAACNYNKRRRHQEDEEIIARLKSICIVNGYKFD